MLGASTAEAALEDLQLTLNGTGKTICDDILSIEMRTLLTKLGEGTAVQFVVADQTLDAIPWELARDPTTGVAINQRIVLMRVPARRPSQAAGSIAPSAMAPAVVAQRGDLVYVLGQEVYNGTDFGPVRDSSLSGFTTFGWSFIQAGAGSHHPAAADCIRDHRLLLRPHARRKDGEQAAGGREGEGQAGR
jgi:hypothetical protein